MFLSNKTIGFNLKDNNVNQYEPILILYVLKFLKLFYVFL